MNSLGTRQKRDKVSVSIKRAQCHGPDTVQNERTRAFNPNERASRRETYRSLNGGTIPAVCTTASGLICSRAFLTWISWVRSART